MVEESVAWDAHIVCRSDGCLLLLWLRVVRLHLLCGCGILLFDQILNPRHHRSRMMRICLVPRFLQLAETNQSTLARAMRICAEAVSFSLCCSCAPSVAGLSIDLRAHWQERSGSRFAVGSRERRWGKSDFAWKANFLDDEA